MQDRLRRILNSWAGMAIMAVILFFVLVPYYFAAMPSVLSIMFKARFILVIFLAFCMIILSGGIRELLRRELLFWLCLAWSGLMVVSMKLNGKGAEDIIPFTKDILVTCWLAVLFFSVFSKINTRKLIAVLFFYFFAVNTLNNASVMFFCNTGIPIGSGGPSIPEYVFFGHINEGIVCGLNSILFGSIYCLVYEKKWMIVHWINIGYSICTAIAIDCLDQIFMYVAATALMFLCIWYRKDCRVQKFFHLFCLRNFLLLGIILTAGIILLAVTGLIDRPGFYPILHGRAELYHVVAGSICAHPVLGAGYTTWLQAFMHYGNYKTFWHQHSFYLQVLYEIGIVGAVLYGGMFTVCCRSSSRIRQREVRFVIEALIGVFFLALLVEVCGRPEIYLLLGALRYLPEEL